MNHQKGIPCSVIALYVLAVVIFALIMYMLDIPMPVVKKLSIILVVIAFVIFLIYWPFGKKEQEDALDHIEEERPGSYSLILVQNMTEKEIVDAIESYNTMGKEEDENFEYYMPEIKNYGNDFLLLFAPTINYRDFCFWVNYLVYSDKNKRHNNDITGWYEMGNTTNEHPLSNKMLMMFIPESDKEFDNVYLVDNFNNCYKQEFAFDEKIIPLKESIIRYKEIPDYRPE
ncbi:MAG: hypothetical protein IKX63_02505 [Muribaculaceae bacterium]|nr:hypothetical protein [Muribaculaceae bacterium]